MSARIAVAPARRPDDYLESIRRVHGVPVPMTTLDDPLTVLSQCDGLLLTGGGDIDPALYGEAPHATFVAAERGRDALELELAVRAIERDIPILAICRGLQVLNVALGGTLHLDIRGHDAPEMKLANVQPLRSSAASPCARPSRR